MATQRKFTRDQSPKPIPSTLTEIQLPEWMQNVIYTFVRGIPQDSRELCTVNEKPFPAEKSEIEQNRHLSDYTAGRLRTLAVYEYMMWMNGRLPFISPREIQIWRLRQFVQYIWFWNLPDDEDIAMIFNTTKQKASNLANDFIARFRKTVLFPVALRRLWDLLTAEPMEKGITKNNIAGSFFAVPAARYVDDANLLIAELRMRRKSVLAAASLDPRDRSVMWISDEVLNLLADAKLRREIEDIYPIPESTGYEG